MAVNDHGEEVLKKTAEEVVPGSKADYYLKTKVTNATGDEVPVSVNNDSDGPVVVRESPPSVNTIQTTKTTVTTSITQIETPDDTGDFIIFHNTSGTTVYIGNSEVDTDSFLPMDENDIIEVKGMQSGNNNELYAIVASGTATVYTSGLVSE